MARLLSAPVSYTHLDVYKRQVVSGGHTRLVLHRKIGGRSVQLRLFYNGCLLYTSVINGGNGDHILNALRHDKLFLFLLAEIGKCFNHSIS